MIRKVLFRTTRAVKQGSDCVTFRRETAYASRGYALAAEQKFVLLTCGEKSLCCYASTVVLEAGNGNDVIDEMFGHMIFIIENNHPLWHRAVMLR